MSDESRATGRRDRQLWLVPTEGQAGQHAVADVAIRAPVYGLRAYAVPEALAASVQPGAVVRVPVGRHDRLVSGLCVRVTRQPWDHTRRPVVEARPPGVALAAPLAELGLWISEYYACWPWKVFAALVPALLRSAPGGRRIACLRRTEREPPARLTPGQAALLAALAGAERPRDEALRAAGVGPGVLRGLVKAGLVERRVRREAIGAEETAAAAEEASGPGAVAASAEDAYELTAGQAAAVARIGAALEAGAFRVLVLFGVPGSGKTEVYVRAIRAALARGRQAILLIPEIALTTQLIERLRRRFARVGVLHSGLSAAVRRRTLAAVAAGTVDVVVGTRTAVFAPCPRLGLLVVDEEQEPSFKNLAAPYYHARDVAIKRGQLENVPVVLGSATPSLETWLNAAQRPHYELLRLPERVPGAQLPRVRLVSTAGRPADRGGGVLAAELRRALEATLAAGHQAILLHNRRGYARYLRCASCGLLVRCEHCGVHLVYHEADRSVKCHRCGRRRPAPPACLDSSCGGRLERVGAGIQRLEEELRAVLPQSRRLRLDTDTMRRRADYEAALAAFEAGAADVLLGTQMVAKGLDFPNVRLVGVIEADAALDLPDFRAGERALQLVVQVVGRAGRRAGESLALVQTARCPPVLADALRLDYESFAARELEVRRRFGYPPWVRLARLVCADSRPRRAREAAERLAEGLRGLAGRMHAALRVDPAEPCVIARHRGRQRFQILVRGPRDASLSRLLAEAADAKLLRPAVERLVIDVDPVDLL